MDNIKTLRYSDIFLTMYSNNFQTCLHRNHSHVLAYMYSGELEINERGEITKLHEGECAFIRKDNTVQLKKKAFGQQQFKAIFLMFTRKFLQTFFHRVDKKSIPIESKRDKTSLLKIPVRPDVISLFESMTPYFNSTQKPTDELLELKMTEGIYVLLNTDINLYASLFDFAEPWKIDILNFLNENYMYDLTLAEIASYTGRSLSTFRRDFKKCSNMTPQKWLIQKRLEEAHALIGKGKKRISEICFDVGFKNLSHFSKVYKEKYGHSPKDEMNA